MPPISWQTVIVGILAALITALASVAVSLIQRSKHPVDVSSSLMNEALDLVESLREERMELRNELASLRTEVVKCRQDLAALREENQKLRLALQAYGETIEDSAIKASTGEAEKLAAPVEEKLPPRRASHRRPRTTRSS